MFRFDAVKALETILYVASKAKTDKYTTLKILYLADKLHLERYGRFIAGDYYYALKEGATPMQSYDIIEYAAGTKDQCVIEAARDALQVGTQANQHALSPQRDPDLDVFSETDIECLDEVISRLEGIDPSDAWKVVREDVHDAAWRKSWDEKQFSRMPVERIAEQFPHSDELIEYLRQG